MTRRKMTGLVAASLMMALVTVGQGFKIYPGAKKYTPPDTEETREAAKSMPPGTVSTIYLSDDAYEKVSAFYKGIGKEYEVPGMRQGAKLPSGQEVKQAFYIFDGAGDLMTSKSWAKVQRPFVGSFTMKDGVPEFNDVRDVTAVVVVEKK